ncbi:MAG: PQQ-binding-like beta-propeller repeat protein [Candidatus Bathyarchaeota archaeon]|nr:PQQ-binding-like beta-propeller repeat protein [Candidatus Bathyarchaeota archaeon]
MRKLCLDKTVNLKSKISKPKVFAATLLFARAISVFAALPITTAHDPAWEIPTYAYIAVAPKTIGVGETAAVVFWLNWPPPTAAGSGGDRWQNMTIEVTKPDGSKETLGPFISDPVGGAYAGYTPDQVGTYTLVFNFPGQIAVLNGPTGIPGSSSAYINDTFLPSTATATLTVQQDALPLPESYPLPTSYWTRPIEGQNTNWASIASNWLGSPQIANRVQQDGLAANTAHIMWTKPLSFGGVVGGTRTGTNGMTYYSGTAYEGKMSSALIINGRLYYNLPRSDVPSGDGYVCVDLLTGEQIYWQDTTMPSFAQLYDYESMNQHGVVPNGFMWSTTGGGFFGPVGPANWTAYDPINGEWLFTLTNVPAGTNVYGPNGEILIYQLSPTGSWVALWNNTAAQPLTGATSQTDYSSSSYYQWRPVGKTVDASDAYTWNVTLPTSVGAGATILKAFYGDMIIGRTGAFPSVGSSWSDYKLWAINMNASKGQIGSLLWEKTLSPPDGNITVSAGQADPLSRVFTLYYKETIQWMGYSMDTGEKVWGPTEPEDDWNFYALTTGAFGVGASVTAYGNLYTTGYSGIVYCYDMKTGNLLWNYTQPVTLATPYGAFSLLIGAVADGKLYAYSYEHSANAPHWTGSKFRCIDAFSGEELWNVAGWGADGSVCVADGYVIYLNLYDMQIYCFGKGPSATTVEASPKVTSEGGSVLIEGTVTDISAGAKQLIENGEFNVVPAVSDESMSAWMEYIYCQKPLPKDAVGVNVHITAIDPNGNLQDVGIVTADSDGLFKILWTPPVPGEYVITAAFEETQSYWPSNAKTAIGVTQTVSPEPTQIIAPTSPTPEQSVQPSPSQAVQPTSTSPTTTYFAIGAAVIIIAIAAIALILRKRK